MSFMFSTTLYYSPAHVRFASLSGAAGLVNISRSGGGPDIMLPVRERLSVARSGLSAELGTGGTSETAKTVSTCKI